MFKKLSLLAAVMAFCLVVLGAYVRLSDAGLGCPDWPGCYGTLTVPQSEMAINKAQQVYPDAKIEAPKAWKEMAHRYVAGTLGLLVLTLCVLAWKKRKNINTSPWLSTALLGLIVFQAMLGMWTVTLLLKPVVVSAHLIGGLSTLAILVWIAYRHWGVMSYRHEVSTGFVRLATLALLVLFIQMILGGWTSTNYAALACTDFPTCHGNFWPSMDFKDGFHVFRELGQSMHGGHLSLEALTAIQMTHRLGALVTALVLGLLLIQGFKYNTLKRLSFLLLLALSAQIALGISNLIFQLPLVLAVMHNAGAASLVVILVMINAKIRPLNKSYF